jgi:hypothetical protein
VAFLTNRAVNLLNLHYAVQAIAMYGGGAFICVYLLKAGVSAPWVLAAQAIVLAGRFAVRPLILPLGLRFGIKPLLVTGSLINAAQYLLIARVHGVGFDLMALCAVGAVGDAFYWTAYHAYFASLGDAENRGRQVGLREAVAAAVSVVAPLAAGWALTRYGPHVAFGVTSAALTLSAAPILFAPNVAVARTAPGLMADARGGVAMFAADGWIAAGVTLVWPIALFQSLGQSFTAFGGAMALAALAGAASSLMLGRAIDRGSGGRAAWLAGGAMALALGIRAASYGHPLLAVIGNAAGALIPAFYTPTLMTAVYNQSKGSPCALRFHMAAEGGWDFGAASGCLLAAGLLWLGAPIGWGILAALLGTIANLALLRRYYGRLARTELEALATG